MPGKKSVWERLIDRTQCLNFTYTSVKSGMQLNSDWSKQKNIKILAELRRNLLTFALRFCRNEITFLIIFFRNCTDILISILSEWNSNFYQNEIIFLPEWNHIPTGMKSHTISDSVKIYWHSHVNFVGIKFQFPPEWYHIPNQIL